MPAELILLLTIAAAYLVGGIPFGYLIARRRGVDIFQAGSGNIGATNVGRVLGRKFGILVFLLDFAKGALPVAVALQIKQSRADLAEGAPFPGALEVGAGLAAFLGHLFPVYLKFRGGKGVATGAGVVAVLMPLPAVGAVVTWLATVSATRIVSLGSLAAAAALCVLHIPLTPVPLARENLLVTLFCLVAAALIIVKHRANLGRLVKGTENRLQETPTMLRLSKTLHVLAVGLWFGSSVFFSLIVALSLFSTFETLGQSEQRPAWFPRTELFQRHDDALNGPKEQGSRAAGYAIAPLFDWFFPLQGICGLLAVGTALGWPRSHPESVHRLRGTILLVALVTVLIGWPLERKVSDLREPRNQATEAYLQSRSEASLQAMKAARGEFATWHLVSLALNFVTLGLVTWGMALAARLPQEQGSGVRSQESGVRSQGSEMGNGGVHPPPPILPADSQADGR
jgi:glycerol-3-phosphate acyltransferase PlsY